MRLQGLRSAAAWIEAWQHLPAPRRRLLLCGWLCIVGMLLWLFIRAALGFWQESQSWQALAQQVAQLPQAESMTQNQWHSLLQSHQALLTDIQPQGAGWQLKGQINQVAQLQPLLQAIEQKGWKAQWAISRMQSSEVSFELLLTPKGNKP